jgi:hypothetical protein
MAYFKDLTPHGCFQQPDKNGIPILNVGWLGLDDFETGDTSPEFKEKLFQFCLDQNIVAIARGFQECVFCGMSWSDWGGKHPDYGPNACWMSIGDGEIRVLGNSVIYAAPALIYHYVVEHYYKPPQEFVNAVLKGPQPGSKEHQNCLDFYKR